MNIQWSLKRSTITVVVVLYCLSAQYTPCSSGSALNSLSSFLVNPLGKSKVITIKENANKSPVVFIPGDGGSQMEARLNKTQVPHYICSKTSDWFDIWVNLHLLLPGVIDCFIDNFSLHWDSKTRTTQNTEGVEIRATNFGALESVDYLNIYRLPGTDYFDNIITTLKKRYGYQANVDMVGAAFDFRKAPNELAEYFDNLKDLIENQYASNNKRPVTLICHSMGCLNSLYLLNRQSEDWKEVHVRRLIAMAAPWSGSFKALNAVLNGDTLGIPLLNKQSVQKLQSNHPGLMYLFPREPAFAKTRVLVQTPTRNYSLENLDELFVDAKLLSTREIWHDTRAIADNLKAPNVELWCLYGSGIPTPSKLIYKDSLGDSNYLEVDGEGDGTVSLESLRACEDFKSQQEKPVHSQMFSGVDHINILKGNQAANFISTTILEQD